MALKAVQPVVSLWKALALQAVVGLILALLLGWGRGEKMYSALYGSACVLFPNALYAYGMSRQGGVNNAALAMFGFVLWEVVKLSVSVIMMVAAPGVVPQLSWPVFVLAVVVGIKVNWLALLMQGRVKKNVASDNR